MKSRSEAATEEPEPVAQMVSAIVPRHWVCYPIDRRGHRLSRPGQHAGKYDCHYVRVDSQAKAVEKGAYWLRFFGYRFYAVDAVPYVAMFRKAADGALEFWV